MSGRYAKASLREEDVVRRFGGGKIVGLFAGPSARAAELAAERVCAVIAADDDAPDGTGCAGGVIRGSGRGVDGKAREWSVPVR